MGLTIYTSMGKVKHHFGKENESRIKAIGKDMYDHNCSKRIFVDVKDGVVGGWFEEKSRIQQRFFWFSGPRNSPKNLRAKFNSVMKEYFKKTRKSFTDRAHNGFVEEYMAGSPQIKLPHSKEQYEKELKSEGLIITVAEDPKTAMEAAREISMGLGNLSYMSLEMNHGLNKKTLSRLASSTSYRPAPKVVSYPVSNSKSSKVQNGELFKSFKARIG